MVVGRSLGTFGTAACRLANRGPGRGARHPSSPRGGPAWLPLVFFAFVAAAMLGVHSLSIVHGRLETRLIGLWVAFIAPLWLGGDFPAPRTRQEYLRFLESTLADAVTGVAA